MNQGVSSKILVFLLVSTLSSYISCLISFAYLDVAYMTPVFHPMAISALIALSTGTICAEYSVLHCIVLNTPLPAATNNPTGPFKLSTQPATGSSIAGHTETEHCVEYCTCAF